MLKAVAALAASVLFAATSLAQDETAHKKQIDVVADAVTSAQTCAEMGYRVDFDGILAFREQTRDAAVRDGMDAAEVEALQQDAIDRKYKWLSQKYANADRMVEESDNRWRHKKFWDKRCKQLSKNESARSFFKRIEA